MLKMKVFQFLCVLLHLSSNAHCQTCSDFDAEVLILGGGMAGVSAANRLAELGITDFIILESQDRLGGRMRAAELVPEVTVNLGANWIQGVDPAQSRLHPLFDLAERCGGVEGFFSDFDSIVTYYSNGTVVDEASLRYDAYEAADEVASELAGSIDQDRTVRDALTEGGWVPASPEDNFVEWFEFDFCTAQSPNTTSLLGFVSETTYSDFLADTSEDAGDYHITDSRGFPALIQCLANNFSADPETDRRIRLNTMVTQIEYSDECVCATATQDGEERTYCAPYAIVTFSVGVLKDGASTLFSPALPEAKVNALNFIEMAFYHIVYAVYDERFWDDYEYIGHIHPNRGYFPVIRIVPSQKVNATAIHVTEDLALRLTSLPEDELKSEITQVFRGIYGDSVPEPNRILSFPWATDPSFLGSYSNIRFGGSDLVEDLQAPEGRMHFAGEGVSEYFGYTHGAYLSGIETANAVQRRASFGFKLTSTSALSVIAVIALWSIV